MSGKHDKAAADDASAGLLATGPNVVRGLGRGVREALRPGRPNRHRALVDGVQTDVADEEPVEGMVSSSRSKSTEARVVGASDPEPTAESEPGEPPGGDQAAEAQDEVDLEDAEESASGLQPLAGEPRPQDAEATESAVEGTESEASDDADRHSEDTGAARPGPEDQMDSESDRKSTSGREPGAEAEPEPEPEGTPDGDRDAGAPAPAANDDVPDLDTAEADLLPDERSQAGTPGADSGPDGAVEPAADGGAGRTTGFRSSYDRHVTALLGRFTGPVQQVERPAPKQADSDEQDVAATPAERKPEPPEERRTAQSSQGGAEQEIEVDAAVPVPGSSGPPSPPAPARVHPPRRRTPLRDRFSREVLGLAVLVVLALICAGLIVAVIQKTQNDSAIAAREAENYTPLPLSTPLPTLTGTIAVIGDQTVTGGADGVEEADRWPGLLADALEAQVVQLAVPEAGYAVQGEGGDRFGDLIEQVPTDADVVVFVGGGSDVVAAPLSVLESATDAIAAVGERAPDAEVVVVGPVVRGDASAADVSALRGALRQASRITETTWADPIGGDWLDDSAPTAVADLTAADQRSIANRMDALLEEPLSEAE